MALTEAQYKQQKQQAEEMLFSGPETLGFAKGLFFGHFNADLLFPYPELSPEQEDMVEQAAAKVRQFAQEQIDADSIDRQADIPESVIRGLGDLGVLGMTAPSEYGGLSFSQQGYCKVMEVIGGHCASTAVFVNAHHSIGIRALLLFGSEAQQKTWLPDLVAGRKLAAFALTEPQAGSDAANVQTQAVPTEDGTAYLLTGEKHYITNGGIADVLTVMARTPAPSEADPNATKVTAFLVTPDMEGFEVVEARAEKCGIRGTATGRMRFHAMRVPKENILGPVGKGLRVALTVLDFGRTTFGASCTGVAKVCLAAATQHAKTRIQFQQPLAGFELVQKKLAFMAAHVFAMEAATTQCAAFIDRGAEDYMLETAILKVFATEHLWTIINDTIQIFGGKAYFCDQPYERMMRDARINTIGEGANDVLKAFIAVVGSRSPGMKLDALRKSFFSSPLSSLGKVGGFVVGEMGTRLSVPNIPVQNRHLNNQAHTLGKLVKRLGTHLPWVFLHCGSEEAFAQSQLLHERLADVAIDLYAASCVLSRLDHLMQKPGRTNGNAKMLATTIQAGKHFLTLAFRRIENNLAALSDRRDEDASTLATARSVLEM